mmetsp:Transcript_31215/g.49830  ORF Transcript_31215/g.49830 Transcript_31215/m.49830 type:complete len:283 (-) Transcript_31215:2039-2887(-)
MCDRPKSSTVLSDSLFALIRSATASSRDAALTKLLSTSSNLRSNDTIAFTAVLPSGAALTKFFTSASESSLNPLSTLSKRSIVFSKSGVSSSSCAKALNCPSNCTIFLALLGSLSSSDESKSPADTIEPGESEFLMRPVSLAFSGMIIFIASTSTYGWPAFTSAPSSNRYRTTFPVTSVRNSEGSYTVGKSTVVPSKDMRNPNASSFAMRRRWRPPKLVSNEPSGRSRTVTSMLPPLISRRMDEADVRVTLKLYLVSSYVSSRGKEDIPSSGCNETCPLLRD